MAESTVGTYLLAPEHADAIQRLAADPAIAATTRVPHPYPAGAARAFVERQIAARNAGTAWTFAIVDRGELVGLCGLDGVLSPDGPELGYWIGKPHWGKGYASFGVKMALEFAFANLGLQRVRAFAHETNAASRRSRPRAAPTRAPRDPRRRARRRQRGRRDGRRMARSRQRLHPPPPPLPHPARPAA